MYVDDIIVASPDESLLLDTKTMLERHFKLIILGDLKYFLGLEIAKSSKGIHLCQRKYTLQLLQDTGFTTAKPLPVPLDSTITLNDVDGDPFTNIAQYRRLIGRLMYLTISRPDIAYSVNRLSQFMSKPRTPHLRAVHQLLRYLKGNPGQGLLFLAISNLSFSLC